MFLGYHIYIYLSRYLRLLSSQAGLPCVSSRFSCSILPSLEYSVKQHRLFGQSECRSSSIYYIIMKQVNVCQNMK